MLLKKRNLLSFVLALIFVLGIGANAFAAVGNADVNAAVAKASDYMYNTVKSPQVGSIGGEWAVIGLARSGYNLPQSYIDNYYNTVSEYVKACKGVLHEKKYTEYSRVIVALASLGYDARNVAGYDLTLPLGDFDKTVWQGINGPIWALIALDTRDYPMPQNNAAKTQATRDMYIKEILDSQLADGGWALSGNVADPDMTGMALQALSKYQDRAEVKAATDKALTRLSQLQQENGGYTSWGTENSESVDQVIVALCSLGISLNDERFVKNGNTLLDNLFTFYDGKTDCFKHTVDGSGSSQMAAEQGLYAIAAVKRANEGKNRLYDMSDVAARTAPVQNNDPEVGPTGKDAAVSKVPVSNPGVTFDDISGANAHKNQSAIEALAARGIITGDTDSNGKAVFRPADSMTRAEFAAIVVRALGLNTEKTGVFKDVDANIWYADYIDTANKYGIVNGTTPTTFEPD